jgi:hypothetical protein
VRYQVVVETLKIGFMQLVQSCNSANLQSVTIPFVKQQGAFLEFDVTVKDFCCQTIVNIILDKNSSNLEEMVGINLLHLFFEVCDLVERERRKDPRVERDAHFECRV